MNDQPERPKPPQAPTQAEIDRAMQLIADAEAERKARYPDGKELTWEPGPKFEGPIGADADGNVRTTRLQPREEKDPASADTEET